MTEYNTFGDWSGAVKRAKAAMPTARVDRFPELTALQDWYRFWTYLLWMRG